MLLASEASPPCPLSLEPIWEELSCDKLCWCRCIEGILFQPFAVSSAERSTATEEAESYNYWQLVGGKLQSADKERMWEIAGPRILSADSCARE